MGEFPSGSQQYMGCPDNVGATFVSNDVNGSALFAMRQDNFKDIGVTKAGPLDLLLH